jgi:hypothetical protein
MEPLVQQPEGTEWSMSYEKSELQFLDKVYCTINRCFRYSVGLVWLQWLCEYPKAGGGRLAKITVNDRYLPFPIFNQRLNLDKLTF